MYLLRFICAADFDYCIYNYTLSTDIFLVQSENVIMFIVFYLVMCSVAIAISICLSFSLNLCVSLNLVLPLECFSGCVYLFSKEVGRVCVCVWQLATHVILCASYIT